MPALTRKTVFDAVKAKLPSSQQRAALSQKLGKKWTYASTEAIAQAIGLQSAPRRTGQTKNAAAATAKRHGVAKSYAADQIAGRLGDNDSHKVALKQRIVRVVNRELKAHEKVLGRKLTPDEKRKLAVKAIHAEAQAIKAGKPEQKTSTPKKDVYGQQVGGRKKAHQMNIHEYASSRHASKDTREDLLHGDRSSPEAQKLLADHKKALVKAIDKGQTPSGEAFAEHGREFLKTFYTRTKAAHDLDNGRSVPDSVVKQIGEMFPGFAAKYGKPAAKPEQEAKVPSKAIASDPVRALVQAKNHERLNNNAYMRGLGDRVHKRHADETAALGLALRSTGKHSYEIHLPGQPGTGKHFENSALVEEFLIDHEGKAKEAQAKIRHDGNAAKQVTPKPPTDLTAYRDGKRQKIEAAVAKDPNVKHVLTHLARTKPGSDTQLRQQTGLNQEDLLKLTNHVRSDLLGLPATASKPQVRKALKTLAIDPSDKPSDRAGSSLGKYDPVVDGMTRTRPTPVTPGQLTGEQKQAIASHLRAVEKGEKQTVPLRALQDSNGQHWLEVKSGKTGKVGAVPIDHSGKQDTSRALAGEAWQQRMKGMKVVAKIQAPTEAAKQNTQVDSVGDVHPRGKVVSGPSRKAMEAMLEREYGTAAKAPSAAKAIDTKTTTVKMEPTDEEVLKERGHSSFEVKHRLTQLKKLDDKDAGDKAYREALLSPIDPSGSTESSLDRTEDQRRLRGKTSFTEDEIRDAGANLRQGMRGTAGSANNRALLEFSAHIYNRLDNEGKDRFAAEAGQAIHDDPLYKEKRFGDMIVDIKKRHARLEA